MAHALPMSSSGLSRGPIAQQIPAVEISWLGTVNTAEKSLAEQVEKWVLGTSPRMTLEGAFYKIGLIRKTLLQIS